MISLTQPTSPRETTSPPGIEWTDVFYGSFDADRQVPEPRDQFVYVNWTSSGSAVRDEIEILNWDRYSAEQKLRGHNMAVQARLLSVMSQIDQAVMRLGQPDDELPTTETIKIARKVAREAIERAVAADRVSIVGYTDEDHCAAVLVHNHALRRRVVFEVRHDGREVRAMIAGREQAGDWRPASSAHQRDELVHWVCGGDLG